MDYGSIDDVRALANLTVDDIGDEELSALMQIAQRMFFADVLIKVEREDITYSKAAIGTNIYQLSHYPIGSPENGTSPTVNDVIVEAFDFSANDLSGAVRQIAVTSMNAKFGLIQLSESPKPSEFLYATYYAFPVTIADADIDAAVNFLTAHLATLRLQDPGTITIADLNNALVVKDKKMETRFLDMYEHKKAQILAGKTFRMVNL